MPTRSLRQRHPCQRRLAVLRVIHRCFRSSRIEGRKSCIDVGRCKHFQSGFLTNVSRFVADEAGQYDDGGYSSDYEPAGNSDQGAPRRARLLATRRLLTWRPVLPAGRARGDLMLCFWLTHVSGSFIAGTRNMVDRRCDDNPDSRSQDRNGTERRRMRFPPPPSCFVPVFVPDRGGLTDSFCNKATARNVR